MKKFLILLFCLFLGASPIFAQNEITFIYLNGSNTNTEDSKEDFIKGANRLHRQIYTHFVKDDFVQKQLLKCGEYQINKTPKVFYWGDLSKEGLEVIEEDFNLLKKISPKPAAYVRKFIAMCLHDAIWVSKPENMYNIINKLHRFVMNEYERNNKVVLVGYSAGTFISDEYLFLKAPVIKLKESLPKINLPTEFKNHIAAVNPEDTCADAVFRSKLVTYDIEHAFVFEDDKKSFTAKVNSLNDYTKKYCAPKDMLAGGINFASPFALFYSDAFSENYRMSELMALSYKYVVENNIFWLTVNYSDDPLGFPMGKNYTFDEMSENLGLSIKPNGGFVYDKSDKSSGRTFIMAHLAYFNTSKKYAKILIDAMNEGYAHFYQGKSN